MDFIKLAPGFSRDEFLQLLEECTDETDNNYDASGNSDSDIEDDSEGESNYYHQKICNQILLLKFLDVENMLVEAITEKDEEDTCRTNNIEMDIESDEDPEDNIPLANLQKIMYSKDGKIQWKKFLSRPKRKTLSHNISRLNNPGRPTAGINPATLKEAFELFISPAMKQMIILHTNEKGLNLYKEKWKQFDEIELDAVIGLCLLAGVFHSRGQDTRELWDKDVGLPRFRATMSVNRFEEILRCMRFDDETTREERKSVDKLALISDYLNLFTENCKKSYIPNLQITVDEQLYLWRGRGKNVKTYIPSKPGKYGLKFWVAADAVNSYCINLQLYCGKQNDITEKKQGPRVVNDLCKHLYNCGRNITFDNLFTDYELAKNLLQQNTTIIGTVRHNKTFVPQEMLPSRQREVLSTIFGFDNDNTLCSYVPKKNRAVILLSTMHQDSVISQEEHKKPEIILDYNATKGGVDNLDKLVRTYSSKRKTKRWPMVVFFNTLDIGAYNALVIWLALHPDWQKNNKARRRIFLRELSYQLTQTNMERRSENIHLSNEIKNTIESCGVPVASRSDQNRRNAEEGHKGRCYICPSKIHRKSKTVCGQCGNNVCGEHSEKTIICVRCKSE